MSALLDQRADRMVLAFTVGGQPSGWALRTTRHGRNYTPEKQRSWGAVATELARAAWNGAAPINGPVRIEVLAVLSRPKRLCRRKDDPGRAVCLANPDCTNVQKLVEDAITRAGVWVDDALVTESSTRKVYAAIGEAPGVHVRVYM